VRLCGCIIRAAVVALEPSKLGLVARLTANCMLVVFARVFDVDRIRYVEKLLVGYDVWPSQLDQVLQELGRIFRKS
jgi:hypothetical protein